MPVLFVMEGGYAVADVGHNVVNVLTGFLRSTGLMESLCPRERPADRLTV